MLRFLLHAAVLFLLSVPSGAEGAEAQGSLARMIGPSLQPDSADEVTPVILKLRESARARWDGMRFVSPRNDVASLNRLLASRDVVSCGPLFARTPEELVADRETGERVSGRKLADLRTYYRLTCDRRWSAALVEELSAVPIVEIVYQEEIVYDAAGPGTTSTNRALDGEGSAEASSGGRGSRGGFGTPLFAGLQDYLDDAPIGVAASVAWTYPGGRGRNVRVVDIETGFNWDHEDLRVPFYIGGPPIVTDHGCAVSGILVGRPNGYGITGVAHDVAIGGHSHLGQAYTDALDRAAAQLGPGDVLVIEGQVPGPLFENELSQVGLIPVEWFQGIFDVIEIASARGVIVCEAAGNGMQNLDDPIYQGRFDRRVRHSGAIVIGAAGRSGAPSFFTNTGSRLDLNGWGNDVVTSGYGFLWGSEPDELYTDQFNGTSSATAIVAGAAAALQGAYLGGGADGPLHPSILTEALVRTGSPQRPGGNVGPRPNLAAAIPLVLDADLAQIRGLVRDRVSGHALEGAEARILETGGRVLSDAEGRFLIRLLAGPWTLRVSSFGYEADTLTFTIGGHEVRRIESKLDSSPRVDIAGTVWSEQDEPVAGARIVIPATPIPPVFTDANGHFTLLEVPRELDGSIVASREDLAPDAATLPLDEEARSRTTLDFHLPVPEDFETSDGGFEGIGDWQWGIPIGLAGPSAHSGNRCWGTNLRGRYSSDTEQLLLSPELHLAGLAAPRLAFWHWYGFWSIAGGNVQISQDGGASWETIEPIGSYPEPCLRAREGEPGCRPGYAFASGGWVPAVFDLSPWQGQSVRVRFRIPPTPEGVNGPGWYVDDLRVHGAGSSSTRSVAQPGEARTNAATPRWTNQVALTASPSPSHGPFRLQFSIPSRSLVNLRIVSPSGRIVREVLHRMTDAGAHRPQWDGRDERGREVPAGLYFVALDAVSGAEAARRRVRLILVR